MIIGFDGSRAFIKGRTGTENYSFQLLKALAKIDTENEYLVYVRPSSVGQYVGTVSKSVNTESTDNTDLPINTESTDTTESWPVNFRFVEINYKRFWTQTGLSMQTFKDDLDVLFVPSHTLPIIRNPNLKTVVTIHDLGAEYLPKLHQLKQRLYLKYMTHRQLKGATKIITVSKATKDDLIKKVKIDAKKIEVIYEGVDKEIFKEVKGDRLINSLKRYELERNSYFLFVGTIQPRKNLERLIRAFSNVILNDSEGPMTQRVPDSDLRHRRSLANASKRETSNQLRDSSTPLRSARNDRDELKLVLVGGKGWLSEEIYDLPKKLGIENEQSSLSDRVKFLGHVPDQDLPALYSGALGFVYPSLFEGFGLPILEAMSCGCPVITSNTSSMPEVAGEAAILVDPVKVEEIAEAMGNLISNDKLRDNMIEKGFKQVEKFSWEKCARETLEVFKSM